MTHPSVEFLDLQAALAGEYSIERELGRGGMGVVYLARTAAGLSHPHIVLDQQTRSWRPAIRLKPIRPPMATAPRGA